MPVSTRSKIATGQDEASTIRRARPRPGEVAQLVAPLLRNPHHGLKEKMKTLTLLYERQQQESAARFSTLPSVVLLGSQMKEEKQQPTHQDGGTALMKETENRLPVQALPVLASETKEEKEKEKENIMAFSCPKKDTGSSVLRKLSLSALPPPLSELRPMKRESRVGGGNLETVKEDCASGSRILVFVRLRPMAKKEKEAGSRSCVRIVNKSDVFLTEFASEHDYLRLKRVRGRHFTFDASFPDSTSQQEVYSTT